MPLTLVTGPANAAKAQVVLERYRAALAREPILVVPRSADAEHYRRELAQTGAIIGVRVEPFSGLMREIAARAGLADSPLGEHARAAVIRAAIADTRLDALAGAARSPAFARGLARFVAELEARRIEPPRFTSAMRAWAGDGPRLPYARELAALYGAYRSRLARLARPDRELHARAALDAITLAPARWRATPVFCYGFDDLDALQLDAIETLAGRVGAPVTVSLPGERGRTALSGRAATLETLRPLAAETIELPPTAAYYEEPALHHLERTLFEDGPRSSPGGAVQLLEGGDERAEAELIARAVAELLEDGFDAADIAIVTRTPAGDLLADALTAAGVPYALERRQGLDASAAGRALLALLRVAGGDADAGDLVAWLAGHAVAGPKGALEAFEARLRRGGISDLATARRIWEGEHGRLGLPATIDEVEAQLDALLVAGHEREAALLDPHEATTATAARRAFAELRELGQSDPRAAGGIAGLAEALSAVSVELPRGTGVTVCDALSLRARRVRALFLYGTQEGVFPAPQREESFLGATERAELAAASGLWLSPPIDQFAAERYLFYALCSRPTARLYVSWHEADDAGEATPRSLFVDELRDCFDGSLDENRRTRPGWRARLAR
jgi:ATP-dependent helicase/DNAse subunit B